MSACQLSKPTLFNSNKERLIVVGVFFFIFFSHLTWNYYKYLDFTKFDDYICDVHVQNHYIKNGRSILKLQADDFTFYTKASSGLRPLQSQRISVRIFNSNVGFLDYMRGFYAPSHLLGLYPNETSIRSKIANAIDAQHSKKLFSSLYKTLFLALPASPELRDVLTTFSIAHLAALSGFHLGLLAFMLHLIFVLIYKFFQQRYFPWRSRSKDIIYLSFITLSFYVVFTDFPPSLLRAFTMMLVGWYIYDRGLQLLSFENLTLTILILFSLSPSLVFSIGLWFSVAGVFYILLFLRHFSDLHKVWQFLFIHLWIFILMIPVVHFIFEEFTLLQLLSPLLTMLFILFYPLVLFLHLVGEGGLLDVFLNNLFVLKSETYIIHTPLWFLVFYLVSSLISVKYKYMSFITLLLVISQLSLLWFVSIR